MTIAYFCPYCNSNQPGFEYWEGERLRICCPACGHPVEEVTANRWALSFERPKILCIDDDQLLLGLFADTLKGHDFHPLTASDGPSGIALAKQERPDLILVDVMMPNVDGYEVCSRMRADPDLKDLPIIIVTAILDPKLNVKAIQAGATLAMRKPFDPDQLIRLIRTTLARKAPCLVR